MSRIHALLRWVDRIAPARVADAHCDIPCGVYDPHHAQLAAHTVFRMVQLIEELPKPKPDDSAEVREDRMHKMTRYTAVKDQHAELCKREIRILWGDYFRPEHVEQFPRIHDLVFRAMKLGSKARQEVSLETAEELVDATNEIATIFWKTKGIEAVTVEAPYPTARSFVLPKLG